MTISNLRIICFLAFTATFFFFVINVSSQAREISDFPIVKLRSLDKITARSQTFEANVGSTVKFGPLFIKVQACRKTSPVEQPESSAFLQIWEVANDDSAEWVFSGWMFASSPGLSHMDHPIYDVWVLDCMEKKSEDPVDEALEDNVQEGEGELSSEDAPVHPDLNGEAATPPSVVPSSAIATIPYGKPPQSQLHSEEILEEIDVEVSVPGYDVDSPDKIETEVLE